jgi:cytidylate kinase/pantoate ligase/cytidylate kinase
MIVTIDGPAGAGKSSLARGLAGRLGFDFLDTGALYRCVTLAALEQSYDWSDARALGDLAERLPMRWDGQRIFLANRDVTDAIRDPEVTRKIRYVADSIPARIALSKLQRTLAADRDLVTEGRDQGTEVFPMAECKIFLTASPEERARRRQHQLRQAGIELPLSELLTDQIRRDEEDSSRPVGRLRASPDAKILMTDGMTEEEVLEALVEIVQRCRTAAETPLRNTAAR